MVISKRRCWPLGKKRNHPEREKAGGKGKGKGKEKEGKGRDGDVDGDVTSRGIQTNRLPSLGGDRSPPMKQPANLFP